MQLLNRVCVQIVVLENRTAFFDEAYKLLFSLSLSLSTETGVSKGLFVEAMGKFIITQNNALLEFLLRIFFRV